MPARDVGSPAPNPSIPPDFIPADCPILARHWFGIGLNVDRAIIRDFKFECDVQRLHDLGPRALLEFLAQVAAERAIRTYLEDRIGSFANLDPGALAALAGDRMPPPAIHRVTP